MQEQLSIEKKTLLTLNEAVALTGLGRNKLRELSNSSNCTFVLFNGRKRLFKRIKLEEYLNEAYSI